MTRQLPIPALLRAWREAHGWTQIEAAEALGVSLGAYRDWEQGAKPPAHETMVRKLVALLAAGMRVRTIRRPYSRSQRRLDE